MDNKPILPDPVVPEEPPLQQTPEMLKQQHSSEKPKMPEVESTPLAQPQKNDSKKKKWWTVVIIAVAAVVLATIIAGVMYWATVLAPINQVLDEQSEITQILNEHRIENVDELMIAYQEQSALDCSYSITLEGESFDIIEQASMSWQEHKITAIGNDSTTMILEIKDDAVYTWGYTSEGDEFATKTLLGAYKVDEPTQGHGIEQAVIDAKDTIGNLACSATNISADFSIPEKDWAIIGG